MLEVLPGERQRLELREVLFPGKVEDGKPYPRGGVGIGELRSGLQPGAEPHHDIELTAGEREAQGPVSLSEELVLLQEAAEGPLVPEGDPVRKGGVPPHQPPQDENRGEMVSRRFRLGQQRVPQACDELWRQHRDGGAVHGEGQFPVLIGEQLPRLVARSPPYPALGGPRGRAAQKVAVVRQQHHHEGASGIGDSLGEGHLRQLG